MRSLAIVPARAGSKRVPGKNLARVGDHTLVHWAWLSAHPCTTIVVSTDDPLSLSATAEYPIVHRRKPEHATDSAGLEDVIADVLSEHPGYDAIALLQPTSPFRTAAHVQAALRMLEETGCDSVVSVTRLHSLHRVFNGMLNADGRYFPKPVDEPLLRSYLNNDGVGRAWLGGGPAPAWATPTEARPPSASLGHLVYENGAVYAFTRKHWDRTRNRMGGDMRAIVMHWSEAVEIDTAADLSAARRLAK